MSDKKQFIILKTTPPKYDELELQGEYVMDFFCRRDDGLGYREVKNNAVAPDLSFFVNGIFLGYAELKSNFSNQTARTNGRNKVTTDYLEAVWEYSKPAAGNDVQQTLRRVMLRPFEKSIHLVTTDINDTFVLRNPGQFFDEAKKGFQDSIISITSFRPVVEEMFKPLPTLAGEEATPCERFEEAMRTLYSRKMIEKEILYYNIMACTYKTVTVMENGRKVQKKEYKINSW